jgi:hypothetical protein
MKNITLSADEKLIEAARARAQAEQTSLNEQFRRWLSGIRAAGATGGAGACGDSRAAEPCAYRWAQVLEG